MRGRAGTVGVLLLAALLAGPVTGWLHSALLVVERRALGHFVWYSREFVWMSPLAYTLCLLVAVTPLVAVALLRPSLVGVPLAAGWVATVASFGLLLPYPQLGRLGSLVLALGMGVQVGRWVSARAGWWGRNAVRLVAAQFVVTGILAVAQPTVRAAGERRAMAALPTPPVGVPNVLVIILDTVRAASLSLHGFAWPTTPALERWAADGATFDWAMAPAPWTLPSHASVFTGRYPTELTANWKVPLDDTTPVLTEAFRDRGYLTAAIVANHDYTAWDSGLARGFVHFEDYLVTWRQLLNSTSFTQTSMGRRVMGARSLSDVIDALRSLDLSIDPKHAGDPRRADRVTGDFLAWQKAHPERPFFAFLNYFDAHQGYYSPPGFPQVKSPVAKGYHTAIAWIDQNLDTLFTQLQARGVLDRTLVIVASDHGELFNEHGLTGHANSLYRNVLHVPLVIRYPGRVPAGVRINQEVSLRDLSATIADLAGLGGTAFPGVTLRRAWEGDTGALSPVWASVRRAPNVPSTFPTARGDMAAVFDAGRHYIRNFGGGEELFDYRADPLEVRDLIATDSAAASGHRGRLDVLVGKYSRPGRSR